jgi:hypothetical protein
VHLVLQVQVEFDVPADNKASVVVLGNSIYNLYDGKDASKAKAQRYKVEPLQFHFHSERRPGAALGWFAPLVLLAAQLQPPSAAAGWCLGDMAVLPSAGRLLPALTSR